MGLSVASIRARVHIPVTVEDFQIPPPTQDDVNKDSYRPHSSRAVRLDGGRHGTLFWRISCLLSGREEHLRTFLCLLLQGWRVPDEPDDVDILEDAQRKEPRVIQMIPAANVSPRYSNVQHEKVPQKRTEEGKCSK